jgi:hypothetical protein
MCESGDPAMLVLVAVGVRRVLILRGRRLYCIHNALSMPNHFHLPQLQASCGL